MGEVTVKDELFACKFVYVKYINDKEVGGGMA